MPIRSPWSNEVVEFNNKGLDLIHAVDQVDEQHYSRFINVKSVQEGSLQPRPGSSLVNAAAFTEPAFTQLSSTDDSGEDCIVVTSGAGNAFGTAVEFIASTVAALKWMTITIGPFGDTDISQFVFEIRTGAGAGVKFTSFVTNSDASAGIKSTDSAVLSFPVDIPIATRVTIALKDLDSDTGKTRCFTMIGYG